MNMIRKPLTAGFVLCTLLALALNTTVLVSAQRPLYAFGGGERAVHFNENPGSVSSGTAINMSHITATPNHDYEYGDFLGTLTMQRLGRSVDVYGGAIDDSMVKGAGHFSFTGLHYGNVGLIGHNRGNSGFFSFVRSLQYGDIVTLEIGGAVRIFEVFLKNVINDDDFSPLQQFGDNRLTLVTCLEYERSKRRAVSLIEVSEVQHGK